ncbi:beta galactosidase jelly roll domain-containing protein [Asticcacaulis sp. SL142]|uniref:sialate O-acetylesterase n=1 Tax=Asticcacaulis sp. SL142 TaxID=2995155 RepID=UPI00226D2A00|nr:sialate O-acetylesterase [Asticcacaulis sp. SL142]WAC49874.1 beta galactosidase jelly roll domain-containing protein [Asticcacaulis sp. SL142]
MRALLMAIATLSVAAPAEAQVAFDHIFNDHAVLQRDTPVKVWGRAAANAPVTVELAGASVPVTADAKGEWAVTLPATKAGGPYTLKATSGSATTTLNDVVMGDVWLCSGQSNMEFQTKYATNAYNEIQNSANPDIRFVTVDRNAQPNPLDTLPKRLEWRAVGPETTGDTSAVCYYMAKALQKTQNAPIGMIHSSWGGTTIQSWMSEPALRDLKTYDQGLETLKTYSRDQARAKTEWQAVMLDWWQANEPDAKLKATWATRDFDDRDWDTITANGFWESAGKPELTYFDGVIWYRGSVTLTAAQAKQAATIELGPVDDGDTTFVNGKVVGATESWNAPRTYAIPKGTLKAGKNVIAVRAYDSGGGGGLWGKPQDRRIAFADGSSITLPAQWKYKVSAPLSALKNSPTTPWLANSGLTNLYNGMIAPIAPYTLKGAAWYQGEANVSQAAEYARLLPAMIKDWRRAFDAPDLPFLVVQLANFGPVAKLPVQSAWAELREAQRQTVNNDSKTGLAVTIDIGDRVDIHPTQKNVVGQRLALAARKVAYGEAVVSGGPQPVTVVRSGTDIVITFDAALRAYSSAQAIGFEVCDAAKTCRFTATDVSGMTVTLKAANTPQAKFVRYAWADAPYVNLYSDQDLPAIPFEEAIP